MPRHRLNPALRKLAQLHGVLPGYIDMQGQHRRASTEALLGVLQALGVPISQPNNAPSVLTDTLHDRHQRRLEPVHVVWQGTRRGPALRLPADRGATTWQVSWQLESGEVVRQEGKTRGGAERRVGGRRLFETALRLPPNLPLGYHTVVWEDGTHQAQSQVLTAPRQAYRRPGRARAWGVFAPLYGLHSASSWGIGSYTELGDLLSWVASLGGGLLGTLPLLPAWLDQPCEPSPYSPVTRLAWNEVFIDVERVPELSQCPAARRRLGADVFQRQCRALKGRREVDYRAVMRLKRELLEMLCRRFFAHGSPRQEVFQKFLTEHPHVLDYARFRSVAERRGQPWTSWPARMRDGMLRSGDGFLASERYHAYVQWIAHEQVDAIAEQARQQQVAFYLDMPLGTHREGYDAWRFQEVFAARASGGSPPDPVFTRGQDWGFAPLHPEHSRRNGHAYVRAYLQHHLSMAGLLRLDHVMGLHRLYWVPAGQPASEGAYVSYPAEELYALLTLESHRHLAEIVGENLGTVPPEVDAALARHRWLGMFVGQYEFRPGGRRPFRRVPREVVASVNTHDMPPFHAWVCGLDLEDRQALGLLSKRQVTRERAVRTSIVRALTKGLPSDGLMTESPSQAGVLLRRLLTALADSQARYLLLNLEDLWLEILPQNVPGTSGERVNWRRRLRRGLDQLKRDPQIACWLKNIDRRRRRRGAGRRKSTAHE